jgi:hypothetical protein
VADEVREQEVLACIVLRDAARADAEQAVRTLFEFCHARLAYYKAPGWVWLTDHIPTTATQKIQKHQIFEPGTDPRTLPGMLDLRERKKRSRSRNASHPAPPPQIRACGATAHGSCLGS